MLIVEGPDGSGKTHLIERLKADLGLEVAPKAISSDVAELTNVKRWVDQSLDQGYCRTLFDRHGLISEGIYGPVWNGRLRAPYNNAQWLQQAHAKLSAIAPTIIVCLPPIEEVVINIRKDAINDRLYPLSEHSTDRHVRAPKVVGQIYWQYFWYCSKHLNVFLYDYTKDDYPLVLNYVRITLANRLDGVSYD